jgi:hypothetical protein
VSSVRGLQLALAFPRLPEGEVSCRCCGSGYAGTGLPGCGWLRGRRRKGRAGPVTVAIADAPPQTPDGAGAGAAPHGDRCAPVRGSFLDAAARGAG